MNNPLTLKKKLRGGTPVLGGWTSLGHPSVTEIFSAAPFDFIGIDLEHSTISQAEAQRIIAAAHDKGVPCLPRPASHEESQIQKLLDSGADGIILPNVSTPQQIQGILQGCLYPPLGRRSYGISRAQGYGFDFEGYTASWNERFALIIQIESIEAVNTLDSLLTQEGVDGVMIGPYDISGSLGVPGRLSHPEVRQACGRVLAACQRYQKACGTQIVEPNEESVREAFSAGYQFLVLASDIFLLWKWTERMERLMTIFRQRGLSQAIVP